MRLNPLPLAVAAEIVTLDPPVFVSVSVTVFVVPTVTLPKAMLLGLADTAPSAAPLAVSAIERLGFEAVEVMAILPETFPADDAVNFALNVTLAPAVKVVGRVSPLIVNPAPDTVACEIVTLVVPEFVSVSETVLLLPTTTVPNGIDDGLAVNAPAATPVPDRFTFKEGFEAFEVIVKVAGELPVADGENFTMKLALCPAFSVNGRVSPVML